MSNITARDYECGRCGANCDEKRWAHSRYWFVCEKCKPVVEEEARQDMIEKGYCIGQIVSSELGVKHICAACFEPVIEDDLLCESCQARDDRHNN